MNNFTIYAVDLGGTLISGCAEQAVDAGMVHTILHGDGSPYPRLTAPMTQNPAIDFSSSEIAALLDKLGTGAVAYEIGAGETVNLFAQQMTATGRSAGSDHEKWTINKGVVVPTQLTAGLGEGNEARLSAQCIPLWDGTNDPIVLAAASLAGSPAAAKAYCAGPVAINGVAIGSVQSINVAFGITARRIAGDGEGWPRDVVLDGMAPVITITTTEVSILRTLGLVGNAAAASTVAYLTRLKADDQSMRYANNVEQHISITCQGRALVTNIAGSPQVATVQIVTRSTDGSCPLTIDTTAAIV